MQFTLRGARLVDATMDRANSTVTIDGAFIQEGRTYSLRRSRALMDCTR